MSSLARAMIAALILAMLPSTSRAVCPSIVAGSCWVLDGGTASAGSSASAYGHSVHCSTRCQFAGGTAIILRDDATYSIPANAVTLQCPAGATIGVPDEEGPIREKRGKLILEPSNLPTLDAALDACVGRDVDVRRYRTTLRIAADGMTLAGTSKLRALMRGKIPIASREIQRFTATRAVTSRPAAATSTQTPARELPPCSPDLQPRCVTD